MARDKKTILDGLAAQAIRLGADELEVEHKDGREVVFVMKSGMGVGISNLLGSSRQAGAFCRDLYAVTKKKRRVIVDDVTYDLRCHIFDSFGEDAFRVELRRLKLPVK